MKGPRKWMKKFVCALSIFAMSATSFTPVIYAQDAAKEKEEAAAIQDVQSYIAIEQTSGKILMQNNQDEVRGIASMSKMISQYLILEAIKKGEITWETKIPISARANQLSAIYPMCHYGQMKNIQSKNSLMRSQSIQPTQQPLQLPNTLEVPKRIGLNA